MEEIFTALLLFVFGFFAIAGIDSCVKDDPIEKIIKEKSFCITTKEKGIEFKKCFDVIEKDTK